MKNAVSVRTCFLADKAFYMPGLSIYLSLLLGLMLIIPAQAVVGEQPESSKSMVQRYFQELHSLRADFEQTVFDDQSRLIQTSSGRMFMQKPGRFRWDYREPYPQVIVADGEHLWIYDKELEQVTVRPLGEALTATPLALLSGVAPLEEAFSVGDHWQREDRQWFALYPRHEQSQFNVLRVAFKEGRLDIIELEDAFNQLTRLEFKRLEPNADIDPQRLRFEPPPGVDVIGDMP